MTDDDLYGLMTGRRSWMRRHSPEYREAVLAAKVAQIEAAAAAAEAERRAEQRRQQQELHKQQRAERQGGTLASGRDRYAERHPKKQDDSDPDDSDPDPSAGKVVDSVHGTARTGARGMQAGRERFNNKLNDEGTKK